MDVDEEPEELQGRANMAALKKIGITEPPPALIDDLGVAGFYNYDLRICAGAFYESLTAGRRSRYWQTHLGSMLNHPQMVAFGRFWMDTQDLSQDAFWEAWDEVEARVSGKSVWDLGRVIDRFNLFRTIGRTIYDRISAVQREEVPTISAEEAKLVFFYDPQTQNSEAPVAAIVDVSVIHTE